jgi:hypothetical protein
MPRNLEWYNTNSIRPYPLDDQATLVDNDGRRMSHNLLVDLHLLVPRSAGRYIHIGGISVSSVLATVTFVASENPFDTAGLVPVAAVSAASPQEHIHYAVEAIYPGVGGWAVWGSAVLQSRLQSYKFSSGRQSLLLPRAARYYNELPVSSAGKLYGVGLTGLVGLSGGSDVEVVKECLPIDDYPAERDSEHCGTESEHRREAIVIRLKADQDDGTVALPEGVFSAVEQSLYDRFRGCCGGRPESNTCGSPTPIETINAVTPDCCGNITLRLTGCAHLSHVEQEVVLDDIGQEVLVDAACGVVVDCGLDMTEACPEDTLPALDGTRRWDMGVLCVSESISEFSILVEDDTPAEDAGSTGLDETLPFQEDFQDPIDANWQITQGFWGSKIYTPDNVGGWGTGAAMGGYFTGQEKASGQWWSTWAENCFAVRNTMVWESAVGAYWRNAYATLVPIHDDVAANYPRFGIVFNHRETEVGSGVYEWWSLELALGGYYLLHFDGNAEHIIHKGRNFIVRQNLDVSIALGIYPHYYSQASESYTGATLYASWETQDEAGGGAGASQTIGPIYLANFAPDTGNFGITSKNCHVAAVNFEVRYGSSPGFP